jgi:hypothetical protein
LQFVSIDSPSSNIYIIKRGVSQGLIPGLLLFVIYVNDIAHVHKLASLILYVDDTNMVLINSHADVLIQNANTELVKLSK